MENIQKTHFNSTKNYSKNGNFDNDPRILMMMEELNEFLKKHPDAKILDVGVADGYIYRKITKKYKIFGVDIAENFVKSANENGVRASVCDLEGEKLPYDDDFFDLIVAGETIEHIVNTDFFLSELNRVLKKNGKLIISYPNINSPVGILMMMMFDYPPMFSARFRSPHVRDWTKKTIKKALGQFGFKIEAIHGVSFYLPGIGYFNPFCLARFFPRFSYSGIVKARKNGLVTYDPRKNIIINYY